MSDEITNEAPSQAEQLGQESADAVNVGEDNRAPIKPGDTEEVKEEKRRYQLRGVKVKGQEQDLDLDEDSFKDLVQRGMAAGQTYQEAARLRKESDMRYANAQKELKEAQELKKILSENPIEAARKAGARPEIIRQIAERYLLEEIQKEEMPQAERRALELEAKVKAMEEAQKSQETLQKEEAFKAQQAAYRQQYEKSIFEALKVSGLPQNEESVKRIASHMKMAAERGYKIDANRAAELAKQDMVTGINSVVGNLAEQINNAYKQKDTDAIMRIGQHVETLLGENAIIALQRYGITKLRNQRPKVPARPAEAPRYQDTQDRPQYLSEDEAIEERKKRVAALEASGQYRTGAR